MSDHIIAGMATIRGRERTLAMAVRSLTSQVHRLYVYLNDHPSPPAFLLRDPKVVTVVGRESGGDLGANGKFAFTRSSDHGIYLSVDDDIVYPSDYAARMSARVRRAPGPLVVCVHGMRYPTSTPAHYHIGSIIHGFDHALSSETPIHMPGTGTCAFDLAFFQPTPSDMPSKPSGELEFAILLQRRRIPCVAIPRRHNWLRDPFIPQSYSLWNNRALWEEERATLMHQVKVWETFQER